MVPKTSESDDEIIVKGEWPWTWEGGVVDQFLGGKLGNCGVFSEYVYAVLCTNLYFSGTVNIPNT